MARSASVSKHSRARRGSTATVTRRPTVDASGSQRSALTAAEAQSLLRLRSFLDRLQLSAHAGELEPTNTAPATFLLLALIQVPFVLGICYVADLPRSFFVAALGAAGAHVLGFVVSHLIGTCFLFDITGEVTFAALMVRDYRAIDGGVPNARQTLCLMIQMLWCVRLGVFLFYRILVRGRDWRFDKLITSSAYNLFCWVSQATWVWLSGMCLWALNSGAFASSVTVPLGGAASDYVGVIVWAVGFTLECAADYQKYTWTRATPSDKHTRWIEAGVWRYSRHPNMFGEMVLWAGVSIVASGGMTLTGKFLCAVSAVWSPFFLVFTSLMLLEKRLDQRFGGDPAYERYKVDCSVLVPWPRCARAPTSATKHQ